MKIDPEKNYIMPLIIDPDYREGARKAVYGDVQTVALQYRSTTEAISALLPDRYQPADPPIVTVSFIYNNAVDFMAGRGYRIATVMVSARYDGERDHVSGGYVVIMFEDDTLPIILGRERLGVPKLYADISPIRTLPDGRLRCEASLWGHLLFGIDVGPLVKQNDPGGDAADEKPARGSMLSYKFIPSLDGPPDAAYAIDTPSDSRLKERWLGRSGRLFFGNATFEDISFLANAIDAVKTLPVCETIGVSRSYSSSVLRTDLSRRLR